MLRILLDACGDAVFWAACLAALFMAIGIIPTPFDNRKSKDN